MKYNKFNFTNLILILLATAVCISLCSCSEDETADDSSVSEISSEPESSVASEVSEEKIELSLEQAVALLERDRLVTEIFVCNSLCGEDNKETVGWSLLAGDSQYCSFSAVEQLLNSTYSSEEEIQRFLSYPCEDSPSVQSQEGRTAVFYHPSSGYEDFVDMDSVSVESTDSESVWLIKAKTASGKDVRFNACCSDEEWKLEKGIFFSYGEDMFAPDVKFPLSGLGSFDAFKGKVLVVEMFISDAQSDIDQAFEDDCHEKISAAVDFMTSQSKAFGNTAEAVYKRAYFQHRNVIENNALAIDFFFEGTGFGTMQKFVESNYDLSEYESYVLVVCMNKEFDTNIGIYDNTEDTENHFAEHIIVGNGFSDDEIYASMLKILGNPDFEEEYVKSLYNHYFPKDVALVSDYTASEMSEVTAYACGITDKLRNIYRVFLNNK